MRHIAIITEAGYSPGNRQRAWFDDAGLAKALNRLGHKTDVLAWTRKAHDWRRYDALFVSTTWDACDRPQAFLDWLESAEADGHKRLINAREVLIDGFLKYRYMTKLEQRFRKDVQKPKGFITPSKFVLSSQNPDEGLEPLSDRKLADILAELGQTDPWLKADIVLKPGISADGKDTFLYKRYSHDLLLAATARNAVLDAEEAEKVFQRLARNSRRGGVIVQPYMRGVERGEYSLTYFENSFSHAVHKPAGFKQTDSQKRKMVEAADLPEHMLEFADYSVKQFRELYGAENVTRLRVDLFDEEGVPVLCELEAVEPNTNISVVARDRGAAHANSVFKAYAAAIDKRVRALSAL